MVLIKFKMLERLSLIKLKLLEIKLEELDQILETISVKLLILHLVHQDLLKIFNKINLRNFNTKERIIMRISKNNKEKVKVNPHQYLKNKVINVETKAIIIEDNTFDQTNEENITKTDNQDTKTLKFNNSSKKSVNKSKTK
jgi:hypothetical protein